LALAPDAEAPGLVATDRPTRPSSGPPLDRRLARETRVGENGSAVSSAPLGLGPRSALLVGAGRYTDDSLAQLSSPVQDVSRLSHILSDPDIGSFDTTIPRTLPTEHFD
jgi:hypothetical protein